MDFFGFHPLYVVILLALALIIFGPSRLPKMGAQVGRMMREFQAAREGLTQQMRDAFEEDPDSGAGPTVADEEVEAAPETESEAGSTVAVLDPPAWHSNLEESEPAAAAEPGAEEGEAVAAATWAADSASEEPQTPAAPEDPATAVRSEGPEAAQATLHEVQPEPATTEPATTEPEPSQAAGEAATTDTAVAGDQPQVGEPTTAGDAPFVSVTDRQDRPHPGNDEAHPEST